MKYLIRFAALAVVVTLAGCANVTLIGPDKPVAVGNGISVMPQMQWNQISGEHIVWTEDGANINAIHFLTGIKPGQPLYGKAEKQVTTFTSQMLPNDIQDLVVSTLQRQGYQNVRPGDLSLCAFAASNGFCFDLAFLSPDGLEMKGKAKARKSNDMLDVFLFTAPSEYYYGTLSPTVDKIFASAQAK